MVKIDYHIHTRLCKHARGEVPEYVARACALGFDEIGFADHNPIPGGFDREHRMEVHEFETYIESIAQARQQFPEISIKCGIEVDYMPGCETAVRTFLGSFDFDYVYGSVHYLGDWNFDNPVFVHRWQHHDVDEIYAQYFEALERMIRSGLFDIAAHPDLVKKFGHRPQRLELPAEYERICRQLADAGMCLEVNTSGLRKDVGEMYPDPLMVKIAEQNGVGVVIGSDAHQPEEVGYAHGQAVALLKQAGYTTVCRYSARCREEVALDP